MTAPNPSSGKTIWLVEDDVSTQRLIGESLKRLGFRLVIFDTAEKAYTALKADEVPALMILDMLLPGMSGVDLIRLIKQNPAWVSIPVVVVSVMSRGDAPVAAEPNTAYWINKPFDARHLIETVQQVLATAQGER